MLERERERERHSVISIDIQPSQKKSFHHKIESIFKMTIIQKIQLKNYIISLLLFQQTVAVFSFSIGTGIYKYRIITQRGLPMGLYDDVDDDDSFPDLPPLHPDLIKKRRKLDDIRSQMQQAYDDDDDDDNRQAKHDNDETNSSRPNLFEYNSSGREINDRLPELKRTLTNHISCYFEPNDRKTRIVMEKTECTAHDACWALEAYAGDIMQASIAIAMTQRMVLNESVALPRNEKVKQTDWDEELRALNQEVNNANDTDTPYDGLLGKEFEQMGRSIGLDGLEERKRKLQKKQTQNDWERRKDSGKDDQQWLPGKSNPNPLDDEPWFTG